jgi:hypothetical protein
VTCRLQGTIKEERKGKRGVTILDLSRPDAADNTQRMEHFRDRLHTMNTQKKLHIHRTSYVHIWYLYHKYPLNVMRTETFNISTYTSSTFAVWCARHRNCCIKWRNSQERKRTRYIKSILKNLFQRTDTHKISGTFATSSKIKKWLHMMDSTSNPPGDLPIFSFPIDLHHQVQEHRLLYAYHIMGVACNSSSTSFTCDFVQHTQYSSA